MGRPLDLPHFLFFRLIFRRLTYTEMMLPVKIQQTIRKYAMFGHGERILTGVSGGADSVCLLILLKELGYDVAVAHLNHGLRGAESDSDELFVRQLSEQLSVPVYTRRIAIPADRGNVEVAGRQARKEFFADLVRTHGFCRVALAHNRDDRVETFVLNLLRGAGIAGLTAMEPVSGVIVRPLLEIPRTEIESYLLCCGQEWRLDSTNLNSRFARNRLRLEVIPSLRGAFNRNLAQAISRTIEILSDESDILEALAAQWILRYGTKTEGRYVIDNEALMVEAAGLQRRIIRAILKELRPDALQDVGFEHIEAVRRLLGPHQSGKLIEIPGGLTVSRSFDRVVVSTGEEPAADFDYELQIPGEIHIPELGRTFRAVVVSKYGDDRNGSETGGSRVFVDGGGLGRCVRIRNWKPGDYYKPVGLPAGKLKKLFQRARIPRGQRHRWPVVVADFADSSIIWVASFPVSREFVPRGCSQRIVAFEASPN